MLTHALVIFLATFGTVLVTSLTGAISMSALEATLISAAAAGVTAVAHYLLGLIPSPPVAGAGITANLVSLKVTADLTQVLVSLLVTFLTVFGAQLVAGATHVTSLPTVKDLLIAAITAAVAAAVQYFAKLIPTPKAA
jgi:hypothetical protein